MNEKDYSHIIVESYYPSSTHNLHGPIHIRPLKDQEPFLYTMHVECSKDLSYDYPVGTKFRIRAKIVKKNDRPSFIYSHYKWPYEVLK
jgi:hypothetical protein